MNKNKILQVTGVGILVIVLIFGISTFVDRNKVSQNGQNEETQQTINVSLTIEGVYTNKQVTAAFGDTVLEVLQSLNEVNPELLLITKEYSGLGILVESIVGKTNGTDGEYWQYLVNGVMPQIGADKLELKEGDFVEWRFEKSEF
jgi:hypothetical protein